MVNSRESKGIGWKLLDTDVFLSGVAQRSRDPWTKYYREMEYDTASRMTKTYFSRTGQLYDERRLDLQWLSPTSLFWQRLKASGNVSTENARGIVKYDAYGRQRQTRVAEPDDTSDSWDFVKSTVRAPAGGVLYDGDHCGSQDDQPDCGGFVHLDRDVLGRDGRIRRDASPTDEVTFTYAGLGSSRKSFYWNTTQEWETITHVDRDGFGRLRKVDEEAPDGGRRVSRYSYDALDRLVRVEMCSGPATGCTTAQQTRTFDFDGLGNLRRAIEPESGKTDYPSYDPLGHLLSSKDAADIVTNRTYDCAGRLLTENAGSGGTLTTLAWDGGFPGRINSAEHRNADGEIVRHDYTYGDPQGSLIATTTTVGGKSFTRAWDYDSLGLVGGTTYPSAGSTDVDSGGVRAPLMTSAAYSRGFLNKLTGTNRGLDLVQQLVYVDPNRIDDHYALVFSAAPTAPVFTDRFFDDRNRISSITGTAGTSSFATGTYAYDRSGNIRQIGTDLFQYYPDNSLDQATVNGTPIDYTYDNFGNMTARTGSPGSLDNFSLPVDVATNRINSPLGYQYSPAGNMTYENGRTYTYDPLNRLKTASGVGLNGYRPTASYSYDSGGLRARESTNEQCEAGEHLHLRDGQGNLVSDFLSLSTPAQCAGKVVLLHDYFYANGELVGSVENRSMAAPTLQGTRCGIGTARLVATDSTNNACRGTGVLVFRRPLAGSYDWNAPLFNGTPETNTCCGTARLDTFGMGTFCYQARARHYSGALGPLSGEVCITANQPQNCNSQCSSSSCNPSGSAAGYDQVRFYINDHLGTPRITVSHDLEYLDTEKLGPFGEVFDASPCHQRRVFTGHERDPQVSTLDYMKARFYSRHIARFLSKDALSGSAGLPGSWNGYGYALNTPVRFVDPLGYEPSKTRGQVFDGGKTQCSCDDCPTDPSPFKVVSHSSVTT